jgi:subtilase family serine protease
VISAGGTTLPLDANGNRTGPETAWKGSGGGISAYETEPAYQANFSIPNTNGFRGQPDVAYDAAMSTGYSIYDSTGILGFKGWFKVGGTSAASPQWAALIALADQGRTTPLSSNNLTTSPVYQAAMGSAYAANYTDITSGSNGNTAGPGYDFATGLGSPLANNLVPFLESL